MEIEEILKKEYNLYIEKLKYLFIDFWKVKENGFNIFIKSDIDENTSSIEFEYFDFDCIDVYDLSYEDIDIIFKASIRLNSDKDRYNLKTFIKYCNPQEYNYIWYENIEDYIYKNREKTN